jgi:DNA-binding response OmpR family regulator
MRRAVRARSRRKKLGPWIVDLEARSVSKSTVRANLTRGEFDILTRLIDAGTKIVTRQELASTISRSFQGSDRRTVDALISRLRRKLDDSGGESLIMTAPGFGYRLATRPSSRDPTWCLRRPPLFSVDACELDHLRPLFGNLPDNLFEFRRS